MEQQIIVFCPACGAEVLVWLKSITVGRGLSSQLHVEIEAIPPDHKCPNPLEDSPRGKSN